MTFASFTNLIVAILCIMVVLQGMRMTRSIQAMKSGDLGDTIKALDNATAQARSVLAELKDVLTTDGAANARTIASGESLRDELAVMVGIGNAVADRIIEASATVAGESKSARDEAERPTLKRTRRRRSVKDNDALAGGAPVRAGLH
jgi:hypothetical protein